MDENDNGPYSFYGGYANDDSLDNGILQKKSAMGLGLIENASGEHFKHSEGRAEQSKQDMERSGGDSGYVSHKNKYIRSINKMRQSTGALQRTNLKKSKQSRLVTHAQHIDETGQQPQSTDKLKRNRISAKQSRERKKLYIDLMETRLAQLEQEKQSLVRELEESKANVKKASATISQLGAGFTVGSHHTFKRLQQILERKQEADTEEVNIILDSMRYRIGATGKERVNSLNQNFKQIMHTCFPALHRYLIWCASQNKHIFQSIESSDPWFIQFAQTLNLKNQQLQQIKQFRELWSSKRSELVALIDEIHDVKNMISAEREKSDDLVDGFRNILGSIQCARMLLFIQANRFREQFFLWQKRKKSEKLDDDPGNGYKKFHGDH